MGYLLPLGWFSLRFRSALRSPGFGNVELIDRDEMEWAGAFSGDTASDDELPDIARGDTESEGEFFNSHERFHWLHCRRERINAQSHITA